MRRRAAGGGSNWRPGLGKSAHGHWVAMCGDGDLWMQLRTKPLLQRQASVWMPLCVLCPLSLTSPGIDRSTRESGISQSARHLTLLGDPRMRALLRLIRAEVRGQRCRGESDGGASQQRRGHTVCEYSVQVSRAWHVARLF